MVKSRILAFSANCAEITEADGNELPALLPQLVADLDLLSYKHTVDTMPMGDLSFCCSRHETDHQISSRYNCQEQILGHPKSSWCFSGFAQQPPQVSSFPDEPLGQLLACALVTLCTKSITAMTEKAKRSIGRPFHLVCVTAGEAMELRLQFH